MPETSQDGEFLEDVFYRLSGGSPENHSGALERFPWQHPSLSAENHAVTDMGVIAHAHLAAEHDVVPDRARAGDSGLCGDDGVVSDTNVVANMDKIVDLRSPAYSCLRQSSAVDGCVRADLNVVFEDQSALLRKLDVSASGGIAYISEAVAAEDRAGVDDDAVAEDGSGIDDDAGIDVAVFADGYAFADDCSLADDGAFTDGRAGGDDGGGCDGDCACDGCVGADDGGGMDSCGLLIEAEELGGSGEVELGVGAEEGRLDGCAFVKEVFGQDYGCGGGVDRGGC